MATEKTALEVAITEYVDANESIRKMFYSGDRYEPEQIKALFQRERASREAYAEELKAVGQAVPAGLLEY